MHFCNSWGIRSAAETAALFDAQFLYAHRSEGNNTLLPDSESSSTKIGRP